MTTLAATLLFGVLVSSGVTCPEPSKTIKADLGSKYVTAPFTLHNGGKDSVTIKIVKVECSCLTARVPRKVLLPGEDEIVTLSMNASERQGLQEKGAYVIFADKVEPIYISMVTYIPTMLTAEPTNVSWTSSDGFHPKQIHLDVTDKHEINITGIYSTNFHFIVTSPISEIQKSHNLSVALVDPNNARDADIVVKYQVKDYPSIERHYYIAATVR